MGKSSPATVRSVARRANVSVATVSRVINNSDSVSPSARKAVTRAMEALHFTRNPGGRRSSARPLRIGLLIPDILNPFYPPLLRGITSVAMSRNVEIVLCDLGRDRNAEMHWLSSLDAKRVDGLVVVPFSSTLNPILERHIDEGFPLVLLLDHEIDKQNTCVVTTDNEEGAYHATRYLLDLGHRKILLFCGPGDSSASVPRGKGYQRALMDSGIASEPSLMVSCDGTYEGAYQTILDVRQRQEFTAVFATSDLMAMGIWRALNDAGVSIPDDVSLIGYDDIPSSRFMSLTTVVQPSYEIGTNALALALDLIHKKRESPQRIVLRDSLIIRRSCRKL